MNGYELSRQWWTFAADNKGKVKATHAAVYYYAVEIWNLLGKPEQFGLPKMQAADVIGLNIKTFSNCFNDLVVWGFIKIVVESPNQFIATTISINAVVDFTNATTKAHTNAILTQQPMHYVGNYQSTNHSDGDSTGHIIEPLTINHKPLTKEEGEINSPPVQTENDFKEPVETNTKPPKKVAAKKVMQKPTFEMVRDHFFLLKGNFWETEKIRSEATKFLSHYETVGWVVGKSKTPMQNWKTAISGWIERAGEFSNNNTNGNKRNSNKYDDLIAENLAAFAGAGEGNNSATGWHRPATD